MSWEPPTMRVRKCLSSRLFVCTAAKVNMKGLDNLNWKSLQFQAFISRTIIHKNNQITPFYCHTNNESKFSCTL